MKEVAYKEGLLRLLEQHGFDRIVPPILQPAGVFLDLAGEEIRRTLYMAADQAQSGLCLRPDFTIPVCRAYLQSGEAGREGAYCYFGPIFRQGTGATGEILQAGAESLGRTDTIRADGDMVALAIKVLALLGCTRRRVRVGDQALFTAVLEDLAVPKLWQRRLLGLFGHRSRLDQAIASMAKGQGDSSSLSPPLPFETTAFEDLLSLTGMTTRFGGRTGAEILRRYHEQTALRHAVEGWSSEKQTILKEFLDLKCPIEKAEDQLRSFSQSLAEDGHLAKVIDLFAQRVTRFVEKHVHLAEVVFEADFGRHLNYYTGFVFEIDCLEETYRSYEGKDKTIPERLACAGGGRYDALATLLGAELPVPCVGFSVTLTSFDSFGG